MYGPIGFTPGGVTGLKSAPEAAMPSSRKTIANRILFQGFRFQNLDYADARILLDFHDVFFFGFYRGFELLNVASRSASGFRRAPGARRPR